MSFQKKRARATTDVKKFETKNLIKRCGQRPSSVITVFK